MIWPWSTILCSICKRDAQHADCFLFRRVIGRKREVLSGLAAREKNSIVSGRGLCADISIRRDRMARTLNEILTTIQRIVNA